MCVFVGSHSRGHLCGDLLDTSILAFDRDRPRRSTLACRCVVREAKRWPDSISLLVDKARQLLRAFTSA